MNKNGLINRGNLYRIKQAMEKGRRGEDLVVAFLGGSITQGSLSSGPDTCYAALVYAWWKEKFPNAKVTYLNAGIGATDSRFAAARVGDHVLNKEPDFLLTEFAVNDENEEIYKETYEGLIRQILKCDAGPGLLLFANAFYDTGKTAQDMHLAVAKHYNLPMLSLKTTVVDAIEKGELIKEDLSPDMLHPNDAGHRLIADVIINFLENTLAEVVISGTDHACDTAECVLPGPLTPNRFEQSKLIKRDNIDAFTYSMEGFAKDDRAKKEFLDIFSEGFTGRKVGDSISLEAECRGLTLQYRRTINKPAPVAKVILDGDNEHIIVLDGNFDEDWGDKLCIQEILLDDEIKKHYVEIKIIEAHNEDREPFYLNAFIINE